MSKRVDWRRTLVQFVLDEWAGELEATKERAVKEYADMAAHDAYHAVLEEGRELVKIVTAEDFARKAGLLPSKSRPKRRSKR